MSLINHMELYVSFFTRLYAVPSINRNWSVINGVIRVLSISKTCGHLVEINIQIDYVCPWS